MGRYSNWYVVELERALRGKVPGAQIARAVNAAESRIEGEARSLQDSCRHGEDPERLAVEQLGSPRKSASSVLAAEGAAFLWEAAKGPMIWSFALGIWAVLAIPANAPLGMVGVLAGLVGFCRASLGGRIWVPGPLAASCGALLVVAFPMVASHWRPSDFATPPSTYGPGYWSNRQSELEGQIGCFRYGKAAFAAKTPSRVSDEFKVDGGYMTPAGTVPHGDKPIPGVDWATARKLWMTDVDWRVQEAEDELSQIRSAQDARQAEVAGLAHRFGLPFVPAGVLTAAYWLFMAALNWGCCRLRPFLTASGERRGVL